MERTDWLHAGYDSSQARFLMLTAVTHHNFGSPAWGEAEVRRLDTELTAIEAAVVEALSVDQSSRDSHALPTSPLLPATRPVQPGPARRLSRLLGWLRRGPDPTGTAAATPRLPATQTGLLARAPTDAVRWLSPEGTCHDHDTDAAISGPVPIRAGTSAVGLVPSCGNCAGA